MTQQHHHEALPVRAVILAGGKGTRLRPFTINFPKPLVPVGDIPIIEHLMQQLVKSGIVDITVTLGHLAELVKAYFAHRNLLTSTIHLSYITETEPTGTAGSLALVPGLDRTFLVMNGDLLTDLDFTALVQYHRQRGAVLTIATHTRHVKIDLGVLEFDANQRIMDYIEKPQKEYQVSMGVYVYEPEVLAYIEPRKYLDFPDLVLKLLADKRLVCAYPSECLWLDIGRPEDYGRAQELFAVKSEEITNA